MSIHRDTQRNSQGFTIAEMMVSFFLFSIMMGLVAVILRGGGDQYRVNDTQINLQESVRESLYRMGLEIRESSPNHVTLAEGGTVLNFQIPASVSNSGTITWSSPIVYRVGGTGSQLIRLDTGNMQTTVLANDVRSVLFTLDGNPLASVNMLVMAQRTTTDGRLVSLSSSGEAKLRNP